MRFVNVCLSLPLLMVSCTLNITEVSFRFSVQFLYKCICSQTPGITKTRTSIYEVSFPLEENMGNKVLHL